MKTLIVVDAEGEWPAGMPDFLVATARDYLTSQAYATGDYDRVLNLCNTERAHGPGYYVSLLAEARGHEALPSAKMLEDLRGTPAVGAFQSELRESLRRECEGAARSAPSRPAVAILHTPGEPLPPSDPAALAAFARAARRLGMRAEAIDRSAIGRLAEFDALFLRDTTWLDHYTYEFARRAESLGLVVVDDPASILQCANKVFLNELLTRNGVRMPKTLAVHRDNVGEVAAALGLPCVLKQPDGGFSLGVRRVSSEAELAREAAAFLARYELILAQEYLPTAFDWRVAVFDRRVLFVCRYFMAPGHWQVHKYEPGRHLEGRTAAISVGEAPPLVVSTALAAANLIGDGLYGVDLKQAGERCYVIEVNDNPSIDAGNEDDVLRDALYREVMGVILRRVRERRPQLAAAA